MYSNDMAIYTLKFNGKVAMKSNLKALSLLDNVKKKELPEDVILELDKVIALVIDATNKSVLAPSELHAETIYNPLPEVEYETGDIPPIVYMSMETIISTVECEETPLEGKRSTVVNIITTMFDNMLIGAYTAAQEGFNELDGYDKGLFDNLIIEWLDSVAATQKS